MSKERRRLLDNYISWCRHGHWNRRLYQSLNNLQGWHASGVDGMRAEHLSIKWVQMACVCRWLDATGLVHNQQPSSKESRRWERTLLYPTICKTPGAGGMQRVSFLERLSIDCVWLDGTRCLVRLSIRYDVLSSSIKSIDQWHRTTFCIVQMVRSRTFLQQMVWMARAVSALWISDAMQMVCSRTSLHPRCTLNHNQEYECNNFHLSVIPIPPRLGQCNNFPSSTEGFQRPRKITQCCVGSDVPFVIFDRPNRAA